MGAKKIHYEVRDSVAILRMDDGKANTIESTFLEELNACLDRALKESKSVLLTGREGYFSAGLDLKILPTLPMDQLKAFLRTFGETMLRLWQHPRPVVAAVTGHAIAGGAVLTIASDRRIGAQGPFKVGLNEVAIGIALPPFVVAMAKAALPEPAWSGAMLFGELYDPLTAVGKGYLDRALPASHVFEQAFEEARKLTGLPEHAFATTKKAMRGAEAAAAWSLEEAHIDAFLRSGPFAGRA